MAEKKTFSDLSQELATALQQLSASLVIIHGAGGDSFRGYNDQIQDCFLSGVFDKSESCCRLAEALESALVGNSEEVAL
ncbi:MAG: hypothetical protein KAX99_08445 [Azonexus sp.]|nr:hypothetical protein [Azonexus sp.]